MRGRDLAMRGRMRAASGSWAPLAQLSPAHGWDVSTNTGADASIITEVVDRGLATARNLTPQAGTMEPLLKLAIQNGKNAALFDGSNDKLVTAAFAASMAQPFWVFWVGQAVTGTADRYFDSTNRALFGNQAGAAYEMYAGAGVITGGTPDSSWHCFACYFNGASSEVWRDDVSIITGSPGTNALGDFIVGTDVANGAALAGYLGEAWCVAGANVTAQKRSDFYTRYAKPKWGLL